jgi:hypothetical protein
MGAVELRANVAAVRKTGGCYGSRGLAFAVPRALWREIFSGNAGSVQKRKTSLTLCCRAHGPLPISGSATRSCGLALRFEPRLELGNELVKAGFHPTGDLGPTPVLQRGDGDSQFEFDSILRLEVTTAVAADDF